LTIATTLWFYRKNLATVWLGYWANFEPEFDLNLPSPLTFACVMLLVALSPPVAVLPWVAASARLTSA
jgi:hypothetical protein